MLVYYIYYYTHVHFISRSVMTVFFCMVWFGSVSVCLFSSIVITSLVCWACFIFFPPKFRDLLTHCIDSPKIRTSLDFWLHITALAKNKVLFVKLITFLQSCSQTLMCR